MTNKDSNTNHDNQLKTVMVIHRCKGAPHMVLEDGNLNEAEIYDLQKKLFDQSKLKKDAHGYYRFRYFGTKQEFIDEGLALDGWFPGDNGNNPNTLRVVFTDNFQDAIVINEPRTRVKRNMRSIEITRSGDGHFRFADFIPRSVIENERTQYEIESQRQEYQTALYEERRSLANLASSKDDARERLSRFAWDMQLTLLRSIENGVHGYHLSKETIDRVNELYLETAQLVADSDIYLDKSERLIIENEIKAKKLNLDPNFQGFMKSLTGDR